MQSIQNNQYLVIEEIKIRQLKLDFLKIWFSICTKINWTTSCYDNEKGILLQIILDDRSIYSAPVFDVLYFVMFGLSFISSLMLQVGGGVKGVGRVTMFSYL